MDELSYDSFHINGEKIYRINSTSIRENVTHTQARIPAPLAIALKQELPEIKYATRFLFPEYTVKHQDNIFTEKVTFTDPDFLNMFSFNLIQGNHEEVLKDKNTIILSESIASKYFGSVNPIGKQITIIRFAVSYEFTVNGVIENSPKNSSIQYDILGLI